MKDAMREACVGDVVEAAYRLAAAKWHPDKWASAGEAERDESARRWAEISAAYESCLAEAEG